MKPLGNISLIMSVVAEEFGVPVTSLVAQRRDRVCVVPRMVAIYLSRELTGKSNAVIGRAFNRDHSTILHACKRVPEIVAYNPEVGRKMERVRKAVNVDPEIESLIETVVNRAGDAVKNRLRELAAMDGESLCRKLLPELFGEKR